METIYITKYALTKGIQKVEAEIDDNGLARFRDGSYSYTFARSEWQRTYPAALKSTLEKIKGKFKSLEKQHEKLHRLESKILNELEELGGMSNDV